MPLIALLCLVISLILLIALSAIDLQHRLLPDRLVLPFLLAGAVFHFATTFRYAAPPDMAEGMILGGGLLYLTRFVANRIYGEDVLGLGDVKLMAAAGVWLGLHDITLAIIIGALAGVAQGLAMATYKSVTTKAPMNLKTLSLPAGPGFALGIVITGAMKFHALHGVINP